jgi:biotin transport system permease protein
MISLYISGDSWMHQQSAGAKLLAVLALSITVLAAQSLIWLLLMLLGAAGAYSSLGPKGRQRLFALRFLLPLILGLGFVQGFIVGWEAALRATLKIFVMIMAADLVTATTPTQAMMNCVQRLITPLCRRIGRDPRKISLAVALMIRFIPVLSAQWQAQRDAWSARSNRKPGLRLLIPFVAQALSRTDQIAESLQARSRAHRH